MRECEAGEEEAWNLELQTWNFHFRIVIGQRITALTGLPLRVGTVNLAEPAIRRAGETNSEWVAETTRRTLTRPLVLSSTSKFTVPCVTPRRASDDGKAADPWRSKRGFESSSLIE
jgi:hypothetical protein